MQANESDIILSLRGLRKSYGDVVAVEDLSLDVRRGEILGLLGPNGAGKTTTIHVICGLLRSDTGDVVVDGRSLDDDYRACKKTIGLCPQDLQTLNCHCNVKKMSNKCQSIIKGKKNNDKLFRSQGNAIFQFYTTSRPWFSGEVSG